MDQLVHNAVRVAVLALCFSPLDARSQVKFTSPPEQIVDAGHVTLTWETPRPEIAITLEQSRDATFSSPVQLYTGTDSSTFLSGLTDGVYYFRLRHGAGAWTPPVKVQVEHISRGLALGLFVLGAMSFLAIVTVIWQGNRKFAGAT